VRVIDGRVRTKQVPHIIDGFEATDQITLSGAGLAYLRFRPDLDFSSVLTAGKPTYVTRGPARGFSLPVWATPVNVDEELYYYIDVPRRWDGISDISAHLDGYIDTANPNKRFKIEVAWAYFTPGVDIVPVSTTVVTGEENTGDTGSQYQSYAHDFCIDYDADPAHPVAAGDNLFFRVRRIDASSLEVTGEFVVTSAVISFRRDKLGAITP